MNIFIFLKNAFGSSIIWCTVYSLLFIPYCFYWSWIKIISFVKWSQLQCPYHNYLYSQPQCLSWGKPYWDFRLQPGCPHHCSNLEFFWGWQQPSWVVSLSCRSQSVSLVKQSVWNNGQWIQLKWSWLVNIKEYRIVEFISFF